jgi:hypothetical protein
MSKFKVHQYRDHAEAARVLAERIANPIFREQILAIAEDYELYAASEDNERSVTSADELEDLAEELERLSNNKASGGP